ncbi:MAG: carbohydrate-binding family 9-like protein [Lentisphaeria bacterium]|nr:carbohydrate-binding family 9-like protein [Lentisphaeria bacterium]
MSRYLVRRAAQPPRFEDDFFTGDQWKNAETMTLENAYYRPGMNPEDCFRPNVKLKVMYDDQNIYGLYCVEDQYIKVTRTGYQQSVCCDSCVEIFLQPQDDEFHYLNFEFSGGTAMLLYNIHDLKTKKYDVVPDADCETVIRRSTLPAKVDPEITEPMTWKFFFQIPIALFVKTGTNVNPSLSGQVWHGNVTKCADECSHPAWMSWQSLTKLNFHLPECFGEFEFE